MADQNKMKSGLKQAYEFALIYAEFTGNRIKVFKEKGVWRIKITDQPIGIGVK